MESVLEGGFETIKMRRTKGDARAAQVVKPCNWAHLAFSRERERERERGGEERPHNRPLHHTLVTYTHKKTIHN